MKLLHNALRGFGLIPLLLLLGVIAVAGLAVKQPWNNGASAASEGDFSLVEMANRDLDGSPALAATFSLPLDPRESYDEFVQVFEMPAPAGPATPRRDENDEAEERDGEPANATVSTSEGDVEVKNGKLVKGSWVVGENPRLLFFPHVKPQTRYVIKVSTGLPARNGKKLADEARYSVRTGAVSPAYYFASRGMVLPAKQNGGLPIVTVNVPEVDVQFLRVKPNQLPRFLDRVISGPRPAQRAPDEDGEEDYQPHDWNATNLKGAVSNWSLDALHKLTESVYSGRFLAEQKTNKRNVTFLPVEDIKELREPGIYIAVMSQPNRFRYDYQVTYFYVSDLGLSTRLFAKGADAYVSSLTSGKAMSGVEVSWLDENAKVLARAETDGEGHAAFAERPAKARVVMAKRGEELSLIALKEPALDLSEYAIGGPPGKSIRLFAYSGRDIYRPGEVFDLSILARDADGQPVPPQPVQALLKSPDGKTQFTATWQPDRKTAGYYRHAIEIPGDASTGFWTLELRVDPADKLATTSFRFGVEEFLPERMKLDLTSPQKTLIDAKSFNLAVQGDYLYGAPAAGNRLLGVAQFERNKNPLPQKLPGFEFGTFDEDSQKTRNELGESTLDDAGHADIDIDLGPASGKHSPYTVRATLSLLESGGRPVIRNIERTLWPDPVLLGIRPLFAGDYAREGSLAQFEVVRSDADGKLHGAKALPVRLFRENRDYYWRFDDQRGWHSGFSESDELVSTANLDIPLGARGKLEVPVKYGRYRVEINDPETQQILKYRFYAGWSARTDESQGIRPDRVALKFDKPAYREGETARLTVTPPHAGEALVTVEADKTLWVKRLAVAQDGTTLDIPIGKEWKRHDLYVSVAVLRPGSEGEKVTPARALGLLHLPLERGNRKLNATLEAPQKMEPSAPLKVRVKVPDAKGQQAMVTVSAVDAGILNITRFATPDPVGHFFGKLRYGADMYDVYGRLIEKLGGQKGKLKFGGDGAPKATRSLPKKVRLVDLFSGPVALNAQGEADISLDVPDFNGTLRLMAVVATPDRFANAEREVVVAAPLVAELLTPRFLTLGDQAVVALDLHNLSGSAQKLKVALVNRDGLKIHNAERELALKDQQKQTLRFNLEAGSAFGLSEIQLAVTGQGGLKLARSFGLQVQAATPNQQHVRRYTVSPGASLEIKDAELSGLIPGTLQAHLQISDKAPIDVRSAIHGLLTYPYGCAEQTTSTAYPHVFVDEESARRFGLKPYTLAQRADMLEKAIARLGAMQAPNGGFSLWGNMSEYQYWLSAYIGNFLLDARDHGFKVPENMQKNATEFLLKHLQEGVAGLPSGKPVYTGDGWQDYRYGGSGRFGVLAYGAYALARDAKAPLSTLRQMFELRAQAHSGLALVHLGLALKLMGDEKRALEALAEGIKKPRDNGYWWGDYGSPLRDAALSYALLEQHKITLAGQENLVGLAADELEKNRYTSTQEKLALFLLGRNFVNRGEGNAWSAELSRRDKPESVTAKGSHIATLNVAELGKGVRIKNTHTEKLHLQLSLSGHPAKMPAARDDMVALQRELFDAKGQPLGNRSLRVGETVLVRLSVKPRRHIANGVVVDRIPAGLEVENLNIVQGEGLGAVNIEGVNPAQAMQDSRIHHVEFRDDRFVAAARLHDPLTLYYRARVVTPGNFVFPPLYAEDMYRPDTYGLALGEGRMQVSDGKE